MTIATGQQILAADVVKLAPTGIISMWAGTIANIPDGWIICDGNNGTPNLLAKFVEGVATAATNPGTTGGASHKYLDHADSNVLGAGGSVTAPDAHGALQANAAGGTGYGRVNDGITDIRPSYYDIAFLQKT